jgi:hypothetical protein
MPKKPKVSAERIAELVKMLEIPETITPADYPPARLLGEQNIFIDISSACKAWRKVDYKVSEKIFKVINDAGCDEHEVDALLNAITL